MRWTMISVSALALLFAMGGYLIGAETPSGGSKAPPPKPDVKQAAADGPAVRAELEKLRMGVADLQKRVNDLEERNRALFHSLLETTNTLERVVKAQAKRGDEAQDKTREDGLPRIGVTLEEDATLDVPGSSRCYFSEDIERGMKIDEWEMQRRLGAFR